MNTLNNAVPEPTDAYTVRQRFITSGLRRAEFDTFGVGLMLDFQSLEAPQDALQLAIACADAERMLAALRTLAGQLEEALSQRGSDGPAQ